MRYWELVDKSIITFHLSYKLWKAKLFILCDVIFLVRLLGKFEIDQCWESERVRGGAGFSRAQLVIEIRWLRNRWLSAEFGRWSVNQRLNCSRGISWSLCWYLVSFIGSGCIIYSYWGWANISCMIHGAVTHCLSCISWPQPLLVSRDFNWHHMGSHDMILWTVIWFSSFGLVGVLVI